MRSLFPDRIFSFWHPPRAFKPSTRRLKLPQRFINRRWIGIESGLNARIDVNRSQVELQTQQQRLTSLSNDYEKQKITLARLIGLPMGQAFTLAGSDSLPLSRSRWIWRL